MACKSNYKLFYIILFKRFVYNIFIFNDLYHKIKRVYLYLQLKFMNYII